MLLIRKGCILTTTTASRDIQKAWKAM
jgi:hypothetical protein